MKKIRFVNPIRECLRIQGKTYTVSLIATIVALIALAIVAAMVRMPVCSTVGGIVGIGSIIGFGWWFGVDRYPEEEEMN